MPRIREYTSEITVGGEIPGRRALASDYGGGAGLDRAGAAIGEFGDTLYKVQQQQEVSNVQAWDAKARADWTVYMRNKAAQTPAGDPNFASSFNDEFAKYLNDYEPNMQTPAGKRAFRRAAAELAGHFTEATGLYQIQSAGVKAKQNALDALNNHRNTLIGDPAQFDSIMRTWNDNLADSAGLYAMMPSDQREVLKRQAHEQLALSAVQGSINFSPELGLKQLQSGRWDQYLDADKKSALMRQAEIGIHAKEIEAERVVRAREREERRAQLSVENDFLMRMDPNADPAQAVTATEIYQDRTLSADQKVKALGWLKQSTNDKIKDDPNTVIELFNRLHLGDGQSYATPDGREVGPIRDENDLNAYVGKGLTLATLQTLRGEISGRRTEEGRQEAEMYKAFTDAMQKTLSGSNLFFRDPKGDQLYASALMQFIPAYQAARKSGKPVAELLDPEKGEMAQFFLSRRRPMSEMFQDIMLDTPSSNGTSVTPSGAAEYGNLADLQAAMRKGHVTRDFAAKYAREKGWVK